MIRAPLLIHLLVSSILLAPMARAEGPIQKPTLATPGSITVDVLDENGNLITQNGAIMQSTFPAFGCPGRPLTCELPTIRFAGGTRV